MLERDNFAGALAMGTLWSGATAATAVAHRTRGQVTGKPAQPASSPELPEEPAPPPAFDPARLLAEEGSSRPEDVVRALLDVYLPGDVRPEVRARLVAFVAEGDPTGPALARRAREAVHAILTMAEYQLA
jgi:hypothetical protein